MAKKWIMSEEQLCTILKHNPLSNFVIIPHDNWIVFDIDPRNGGMESFKQLEKSFIPTFKVQTGGGGFHYYYKLPQWFKKPLSKNLKDYAGIDIKTSTGCLVAPGSTHPNGNLYKIADDSINELANVPRNLLMLATKTEKCKKKKHYEHSNVIHKGGRNNAVTAYVGYLFRKDLDYKSVMILANQYNKEKCNPPLSLKEVTNIVKSISRYDNSKQRRAGQDRLEESKIDVEKPIEQVVEELLIARKVNAEVRLRLVSEVIIKDLSERGKFYQSSGKYYIFDNETKQLITIDKGNINLKTLLARYRINAARDIFKVIYEALIVHCKLYGDETEVYKYAHYDIENFKLYLKNGQFIYKISADTVEKCDNGTDNVLFTDTVRVDPYEYIENLDKDYLSEYLLNLPNYSNMSHLKAIDAKKIVSIYLHSLFMPDLLQTKPLISTVGTKGSGKTTLLRMLLKCLYGSYAEVTSMTNKMDDLDTIIAKRHFIVIDNLDTFNDGINDKIASYATGVVNEKRRLYSDGDVYSERVEAFIGISTRNPVFRRDDVAQRVVIIYLEPLNTFATERTIIEPMLQHRSNILSQIINKLQDIIKLLSERKYEGVKSSFRMADFANFATLFFDSHTMSEILLQKVLSTQRGLVLENDILLVYLVKYINDNISAGVEPDWITASELYRQLDGRAAAEKGESLLKNEFKAKYDNSISLGKRVTNIKSDVSDFIRIETRKNGGNITAYRISAAEHFQDLKDGLMQ